MNPDQPSREQIEARITALLLGELPADEAALLRYTIAQDPALKKLHDELQSALPLIREAAKHPADAPLEKPAPLKLSADRREKLLAHFKTPRPKVEREPLFWLKRIKAPSLIELLVAVAIIALLAALMLPALSSAKFKAKHFTTVAAARREELEARLKETDQVAAIPPAPMAQSPAEIPKNKLEPALAPPLVVPPVQIVLPAAQPESGQLADNNGLATQGSAAGAQNMATGLLSSQEIASQITAPKTSHVYSQSVVGYSVVPRSDKEASNAQTIGVVNAFAGGSGGGGGGGGIGGSPATIGASHDLTVQYGLNNDIGARFEEQKQTAESGKFGPTAAGGEPTQAPNTATFAFDNSGANRNKDLLANDGKAFQWSVGSNVTTTPLGQFPKLALNEPANEDKKNSDQLFTSGLRDRRTSDTPAREFYRLPAQGATIVASVPPPPPASVMPATLPTGSTLNPDTGATPVENEVNTFSGSTTVKGGYSLTKHNLQQGHAPDSLEPATTAPADGRHINGVIAGAATDSFQTGLAKEEELATGVARTDSEDIETGPKVIDAERSRQLNLYKASHKNTGFSTPDGQSDAVTNQPLDVNGIGALEKPHFVTRYAYAAPISGALDQLQFTNSFALNGNVNNTFNPGVSAIQLPSPDVNEAMPTIDAQQLQMINQQKIEKEKVYQEQLVQLQALQAIARTNHAKLLEVLPQMVSDGTLNDMVSKLRESEQTRVALANDYSITNTTVIRVQSSIDELNHEISNRVDGIMTGLETEINSKKAALNSMTATMEAAKENEQKEVTKNQPYYDARRDLEQKLRLHELLSSKLEAEKLDLNLPKTSMAQIVDPAQPGKSQTTWQRLTGQVESKARIKVENDVTDIPGLNGSPTFGIAGYDPYFIQTTFEVMQSETVLGKVVDALNLQSAWAKNNSGEKLDRAQAISQLKQRLDLHPVKNTKLIEIGVKSSDPQEAADLANAVAQAYTAYRIESRRALTTNGVAVLEEQFAQQNQDIRLAQAKVERLSKELNPGQTTPEQAAEQADLPIRKPAPNTPLPQPEILTSSNAFSTFSLNVSDVSFKFAEASLQNGKLPDTASIRSEEFINAFDYRDPEAAAGQPMAFTAERARYPFAQNRDLLRFSIKTAAAGRQEGRPLNLVLLLDTSGSMERADRVAIIHEALRVLATQLHSNDIVSVVSFARTARLWADGVSGDQASETLDKVGGITPEGGTNLEEAMRLAYETARRHYLATGMNRVVLLTDGAANLGNVEPAALKEKVEAQRKQGIALDCFGIGWEDYNDDLLEQLSSNGDGRYAFLNSPEDASKDFATKLAGALQVAAQDVKVQVEFNPQRVISYRQIGYATHQLTKEQFRDNTVAAAPIAAQEAGNALYTIETNPNGDGPIATVHVRYRIPGTQDYREHSWDVAYTGNAPALEQSSPAMRLATTASAFSEWLAASPYAQEVTPDDLLKDLSGVPEVYGADDRPKQLETMIREAKSLEGK